MYTKIKTIPLEKVRNLYFVAKLSLNEIALQLKCSTITLSKFLKIYKINKRQRTKRKKYKIDENYFSVIDSPAKAYFLGLMFADGNVDRDKNTCSINLVEEDGYLLEAFKKELKSEVPIRIVPPQNKNWNVQHNLIMYSSKIKQDLIKHGCVPCKSKILKFPSSVPASLMSHFVRGYFDGDGGFHWSRKSLIARITSSKNFCLSLCSHLRTLGIICNTRKHSKKSDCWIITIYSRSSILLFKKYIYQNSTISMQRKKLKVDTFSLAKDSARSQSIDETSESLVRSSAQNNRHCV